MDIEANVLFEIEHFDSPLMPSGNYVSHEDTTVEDLRDTANAKGTIALNRYEGARPRNFWSKSLAFPLLSAPRLSASATPIRWSSI
jgi:nitrogenase molybdenum-iron protein beta chain